MTTPRPLTARLAACPRRRLGRARRVRCGRQRVAGLRRAARGGVLLPAAAGTAEQVGGAHVRVTNLTKAGAEPHDLELTPRDVGRGQQGHARGVREGPPAGRRRGRRRRGAGPRPRRRPGREAGPDVHPGRVRGPAPGRGPGRPTRTSGSTRCATPPSPRPSPTGWAPSTRRTGPTTPPTRRRSRHGWPRSTGSSAGAWPTAPAPRSSPATTLSATSPSRYGMSQVGITGLSPEAEPEAATLARGRDLRQGAPRQHDLRRDAGQPRDRRHGGPGDGCEGRDPRPARGPDQLLRRSPTTLLSCAPTSRRCAPDRAARDRPGGRRTDPRPLVALGRVRLRRAGGGVRRHPGRAARRGRGTAGAQRLGQVDAGARAARAERPPRRPGLDVRHPDRRLPRARPAGLRAAAAHPLGVGARHGRGGRRHRPAAAPGVVRAAERPRPGRGRARRWSWSASPTGPARTSAPSPAASSGGC